MQLFDLQLMRGIIAIRLARKYIRKPLNRLFLPLAYLIGMNVKPCSNLRDGLLFLEFALNSAAYRFLFVLLISVTPPSFIVYFTPYTTVRIPGATSLFFLVRCTEFRFPTCGILALLSFFRLSCTFCFL